MEEDLFKTDDSLLRWPVCQLYRNFTVVILTTFILNPIYRIIAFVPVFALFIIHDYKRMPYKHPYLNIQQLLSSTCLIVIVACNFPPSMTLMTNALSVPLMESVITALQHIELMIYAILPISLLVWKLWNKYEERKNNHEEENFKRAEF